MGIKTTLIDQHGQVLHSEKFWSVVPGHVPENDAKVLISASPPHIHGTFKSATRATAGTTTITMPNDNGSLLVTDLIISGDKQALSTTEVRFTDGSAVVPLFIAQQAEGIAQFSVGFQGRVQGWRNARIDMVTIGTHDTTVLVCYVKIQTGLPFAEWDALR